MRTTNFLAFGEFFKAQRTKTGKTLRTFCTENGFDPGNISKLERGLASPPKTKERLDHFATCLGLEKHSDEYQEFCDLASVCTGQIPPEILNDQQLVQKLPLLFRTLRGQKVPPDKLESLAELIRRS